jgi:hypothetical protein
MLHMVNRIAFSTLGQSRSNAFMQRLEECTIDEYLSVALTEESKRNAGSFKTTLFESFNERTIAYGQYREVVAARDANPKGTLMWEVGKMIAQAFDAPTDIRYIMLSTPLLMQALQQLNTKEILSRLL